jgi:hypothetical protein
MATRVETDMSAFEAELDRPTMHWYPRDPKYRRSGCEDPQPGDVAICGFVKVRPHELGQVLTCDGCRTLRGLS